MRLGQRRLSFLWQIAEHLYPNVPPLIWHEIVYCRARMVVAKRKVGNHGYHPLMLRECPPPTAISKMSIVEICGHLGLDPMRFARATHPDYRNHYAVRKRMIGNGQLPPKELEEVLK